MKDFNSYIPDNDEKSLNDALPKDAASFDAIKTVKEIANKYHGKSEAEMFTAIFKEAEKGRKAGTLSDADLDNFAKTISPFIDEDKRRKLSSVIEKLKK